jgi:hypothetical protein
MREIEIIFTTGLRISVTRREIFELMREPIVVTFFIGGGYLAGYILPISIYDYVSPITYFWLVALKSILGLMFLHLAFIIIDAVTSYAHRLPLPSMFVLMITALILEAAWVYFIPIMFSGKTLPEIKFWSPDLLTTFIAMIIGEIIYSLFVLRMTHWWTRHQLRLAMTAQMQEAATRSDGVDTAQPMPHDKDPHSLIIGKEFIKTSDVLYLKAEQHYVRIVFVDKEALVRTKFEDLVLKMPDHLGLRVHRSFWASTHGICDLSLFADGRGEILMSNDDKIPVSRSYRKQLLCRLSPTDALPSLH